LEAENKFEEALWNFDKAIQLRQDYPEAHLNRGNVLKSLGSIHEAIHSYEQAIRLRPEFPENYMNKALAHFLLGEFDIAWQLYEWRWRSSQFAKENMIPNGICWDGEQSLQGKNLLVRSEQGLGDSIQFCRYANVLAAQGARVILEVERPLVDLLRTLAGVTAVFPKGAVLPAFDFYVPMMSLPFVLKTTLRSIPASASYLKTDPLKVAKWRDKLGKKTGLRVGLAWSGNAVFKNDRNRSLPLSQILPNLPAGCSYVSIQKDLREADASFLATQSAMLHFGEELHDFSETAALCELMDVVISVDTSVAHLSAALGKPTWIILPANADWRWFLERKDSPWYPSVRLFRQEKIGEWKNVFDALEVELNQGLVANNT
jgi:hypothetical protein